MSKDTAGKNTGVRMVSNLGPSDIYMEPLALTIAGAAAVVGHSQTTIRDQIRLGLLEARYVNTKPVIMVQALRDWLESQPTIGFRELV